MRLRLQVRIWNRNVFGRCWIDHVPTQSSVQDERGLESWEWLNALLCVRLFSLLGLHVSGSPEAEHERCVTLCKPAALRQWCSSHGWTASQRALVATHKCCFSLLDHGFILRLPDSFAVGPPYSHQHCCTGTLNCALA